MYQTALREHQAGNLDVAEKLYHDVLKNDPQNSDALHLLGILLAQRQDFLTACHYIEQALAIAPDSPTLHNSMGNVLKNLKRYEEAVAHYQAALQLQPDSASVHNNLGTALHNLDKLDEAKEHYYAATRLRSQYIEAYYNLSLVLLKQELQGEARANLEQVLQLQPEHAAAHGSLACLLQLQGEFDLAIQHYEEALRLGDDDEVIAPQLYNLGAIFIQQQKPALALPLFLRLLELTKDFDAYYNLGVIYLSLGKEGEAIGYFVEALKIAPDDFAANVNLGGIYLQQLEFGLAEQCYLQATSARPEDEETAYILAAIQQKTVQSKAPATYVKHLFNQYAPYFEKHLEFLGHHVPQLLFEAVEVILEEEKSSLAVLDLGCGTGVVGVKFKPIAEQLIGVDISEKMLELARSKNVYTDLRLGAIEDLVPEFSNIDVVIAADTLVYFGELRDVFIKCHQVLKQGGIFAFSVEEADGAVYPYALQRTARFAHADKYIHDLATENNFEVLSAERITLRKHGDAYIFGRLFVLRK